MRILIAALLSLTALSVQGAGAGATTDPPRIVPWRLIGNIGLGMSQARVERMYGRGTIESPPKDALVLRYRGRGVLSVEYDADGEVASVETTSPDYVTRSGIHVGMTIPHKQHRWRGLTYDDSYGTADVFWRRVSSLGGVARVYVELEVGRDDVVDRISLTRYLQCPLGQYAIRGACRTPRRQRDFRFYFPPPPGLRFCQLPGGPGDFLAASPAVRCRVAEEVEAKVSSALCVARTHCTAAGFRCVAYWNGRYDQPFEYTHHAICTDGPRLRIVWDGG